MARCIATDKTEAGSKEGLHIDEVYTLFQASQSIPSYAVYAV